MIDPFEQAHEMFCVDTRRENTPCDGASCRVGIALRAIYRAGLKRAVEVLTQMRDGYERLNSSGYLCQSWTAIDDAIDEVRAELGDDDGE